jgi:hypothetical protein
VSASHSPQGDQSLHHRCNAQVVLELEFLSSDAMIGVRSRGVTVSAKWYTRKICGFLFHATVGVDFEGANPVRIDSEDGDYSLECVEDDENRKGLPSLTKSR